MGYQMSSIIKTITHNIMCDECPYPCEHFNKATTYECYKRWYEILSNVDVETWKEVRDNLI